MIKIDKNCTVQLLDMFKSKVSVDINLKEYIPVTFGAIKYIAASDRYRFIMIPQHEGNEVEFPKVPFGGFKNALREFNIEKRFDLTHFISEYEKIPVVDVRNKDTCPSCDGRGEFIHYKHTYNCEMCFGEGEVENGTFIRRRHPNHVFRINGSFIANEYINELTQAYGILCDKGVNISSEIILRYSHSKGINIFVLDGIIFGIMGKYPNDEELSEYTIHEIKPIE